MQWLDVIDHMIEHLPPPAAADADATADGGSGAGGADGTGGLQREAFRQLVDRYSQTAEGVHLHERCKPTPKPKPRPKPNLP